MERSALHKQLSALVEKGSDAKALHGAVRVFASESGLTLVCFEVEQGRVIVRLAESFATTVALDHVFAESIAQAA